MLNNFFYDLNRELRILKKNERRKYIEQYEELVLEKTENGIEESIAVRELGDTKAIANEILNSYKESENLHKKPFYKYINPLYLLGDVFIILFVYAVSWAFYLFFFCPTPAVLLKMCIVSFFCIIPLFILLYSLFGLYTVKIMHKKSLSFGRILVASITFTAIAFFILYIAGIFDFPRIVLLFLLIGNIIISSLFRILYKHNI